MPSTKPVMNAFNPDNDGPIKKMGPLVSYSSFDPRSITPNSSCSSFLGESSPVPSAVDGRHLRHIEMLFDSKHRTAKTYGTTTIFPPLSTTSINPEPEKSTWSVIADRIGPVPNFYPLERTHIILKAVSVSELCNRVANFMRVQSIEAHYNDDDASMSGKTQSCVSFSVHLWSSRNEGTTEDDSIIVESQRQSGSSLEYHTLCRGLFQAVRGEPVSEKRHGRNENVQWSPSPSQRFLSVGPPAVIHSTSTEDLNLSLATGHHLLECHKEDSTELGLQTLLYLTEPNSVGLDNALYVSNVIAHGVEPFGRLMQEILLDNVQNIFDDRSHDGEFEDSLMPSHAAEDRGCLFHNLSMQIVANILRTFAEDDYSASHFQLHHYVDYFWHDMIPCLVQDLGQAPLRPHDAYAAALCLSSLTRISNDAKNEAIKSGIIDALDEAWAFGKGSYLSLENETAKIFSTLVGQHLT